MRYESINQADVPKGRDGKHKKIVSQILNDLALLDPDHALPDADRTDNRLSRQ